MKIFILITCILLSNIQLSLSPDDELPTEGTSVNQEKGENESKYKEPEVKEVKPKAKNKQTQFTGEDKRRLYITQHLPCYKTDEVTPSMRSKINYVKSIFDHMIPPNLYKECKDILSMSLTTCLREMLLYPVTTEEFNTRVEEISQELLRIFANPNNLDFQNKQVALDIIRHSDIINNLFTSRPSLLYNMEETLTRLSLESQISRLANDLKDITDDLTSLEFKNELMRNVRRYATIEGREKIKEELRIYRIQLSIYISDFKMLYVNTNNYSMSKLVINEVLIQHSFANFLKSDLLKRRGHMLTQNHHLYQTGIRLKTLNLQNNIYLSDDTRQTIEHIIIHDRLTQVI